MAIKREKHIIDAADQVLGRLATKVATLLRGKHRPDFLPNKDTGDFVVVKNAAQIKLTGKKMEKKIYYRHTGYLGGLKKIPLRKIYERDSREILRRAVSGMLPKNKLRSIQIKRLKTEK